MEITLLDGLNLAFDILENNNEITYTKINNRDKLINNVINDNRNCLKKFTRNIMLKEEIKGSWRFRLLYIAGYKLCTPCNKILPITEFGKDKTHKCNLHSTCRNCERERGTLYRKDNTEKIKKIRRKVYENKKNKDPGYFKRKNSLARRRLKQRTPKWLSEEEKIAIQDFYANCPEGYHVDHIIPLNGIEVNGLHVLANLQYLTAKDNLEKSNKFDIIDFNKN